MVAPLLLGLATTGGGLLARRAIGNRRRNRERGLIDAISNVAVGADGVGPPAPLGTPGQLQLLDFMRENMPERGAEFASQLFGQQQQLLATQQRQQILNTAAQVPQLASDLAIREGRETFEVTDPETGGAVVVPVQGTDRYQDNLRQLDANVGIMETLQEMQELALRLPPGAALLDQDSPDAQRLNALQANFIAYVKDADNLGALGQDVLEFAERIAPAGRDLSSVFSSPEALVAALQTGGDRFARSLQRLGRETRFYQDVDPQLRERAQEVGVRRGIWQERVGGFAEPERSTAREAGRLAAQGREAGLSLLQEGVNRAQRAADTGDLSQLFRTGTPQPTAGRPVPTSPQVPVGDGFLSNTATAAETVADAVGLGDELDTAQSAGISAARFAALANPFISDEERQQILQLLQADLRVRTENQ